MRDAVLVRILNDESTRDMVTREEVDMFFFLRPMMVVKRKQARKRLSYTPIYYATCQFTRGSTAEDIHEDIECQFT